MHSEIKSWIAMEKHHSKRGLFSQKSALKFKEETSEVVCLEYSIARC
jgi:hypothetical protein